MTALRWLTAALGVASGTALGSGTKPGATGSDVFDLWIPWAPLPEVAGLKGLFAGVSHDQVWLAGGSNFPLPLRQGGAKVYHDRVYSRSVHAAPDEPWRIATETLPEPGAEGGSAATPWGLAMLGGRNAEGPSARVRLMDVSDELGGGVRFVDLPDLPSPRASVAVAWSEGYLYVSGGEELHANEPDFVRLNLARWQTEPTAAGWEVLPACPGDPRFGATLMPVTADARTVLVLCGGRRRTGRAATPSDYLGDTWCYDPADGRWSQRATMPRPALLGNAVAVNASTIALGGGSDGHDLARLAELGPNYRLPDDIMRYETSTDTWTIIGRMPIGVAAAASVRVGDQWCLAGGEYSPGLRTAAVFALPLSALQ